VAASPGRVLLDVLQRELIDGLHDAVSQVLGDLEALEADPAFDATAFAGRVLAPVEADNPVLAALSGLASAEMAGAGAGLRGWRDEAGEGAPLGVAYVVGAGGPAVAALSVVPAAGARLVLRAAGFSAGQSVQLPLDNGFALRVSGTAVEEIEVVFFADQPPAVTKLGAGDQIDVDLTRDAQGELLGIEGGPSVRFGSVAGGGSVASTSTGSFDRRGYLRCEGGEVALAPGFLASLLPVDLTFPLDLDLRTAADTGVVLAGSPSLRTRLTGADAGRWLDLALDVVDAAGGSALNVSFLTSVDVSLPGAPVSAHVDGVGLSMPISLRLGTPMLPDVNDIRGLDPRGADVSIDLPVVSGSGAFSQIGNDLVGAMSVKIPPLSASAFGVLSPARDGQPLSFLVLIGATFPPPGVQVGFGFAISGVGGVVGINRRIDRDALLRAIADGTAAQLLFPSDPVGSGQVAIKALPAVFPPARGSVVAGPMLQLSWGGRVVTLSVAVLVESSTQVRLAILGKLVVGLPDPEAPLVFLQATFVGIIDPAEPSATFVASLSGSHIVGAPLSGDILLLTRGGSDSTLVLSAGGFHPSFPLPRGVPALRRMSIDLCPAPWIDLRCEGYFALTSNTLQLGARLELVAEVAECGLRGWLAFDALLQYSPFRFVADVSGGIALRAFGQTLVGISLALHLEGPAPYLARGRGSIDLFLFDVSFDFEVGWGSPPARLEPPFDVGAELRRALALPAAWRPRGAAPPGLALTGLAQKMLSDAAVVDPYGAITVRQERVPLGIEVQRFNGLPVPAQRWDISAGQFGPGEPAGLTEVRTQFAPGQFVTSKSDDEALTSPAFLPLKAGAELLPAPATGAEPRPAGLTWEERVIARDIPMPVDAPTGQIADVGALEALMAAMSAGESGWWIVPKEAIAVDPVPPVASAFSWSMAAGPGPTAPTDLEMRQALEGSDELVTVEAWEMAG
jgi:Family of unknown function (DUF6603)